MKTDLLIIGSGIAGLSLALKASTFMNVVIVTKSESMESNTRYAQGGIASVISKSDEIDYHIQDTLNAGSHLSDPKIVSKVIESGPRIIQELLDWGVKFSKNEKEDFDLGMEGGHSHRRVLHAQDITGFELQKKLLKKAKACSKIKFLEHHMAVDVIVDRNLRKKQKANLCYGAYILNRKTNRVKTLLANSVVLATGGAGKTYLYTSNPDIATGDGIGMAYRAGCQISNLEFVQFHPTCLYHPLAKSFLISEALRGEGAKLILQNGDTFTKKYHPQKELAPRDVVARAIDYELKKRGDKFVYLDITHKSKAYLQKRFPAIYQTCFRYGFDLSKQPIPVVPAAHYFCGGVKVNAHGRTNVSNLYAIGEVSCTGLHGANRLASNSLLEGAAFADYVYKDLLKRKDLKDIDHQFVRDWDTGKAIDSDEMVVITQNWEEIRQLMWNYVGIVRSTKRLIRAQRRIQLLLDEIKEYYWDFKLNTDLLELRNIARVADLTIQSALKRKESIGLHYNLDFPQSKKSTKRYTHIKNPKFKGL